MMTITTLVVVLVVFLAPSVVNAQPAGKIYRVGFLGITPPTRTQYVWDAFIDSLRDRGYVEGRNLVIERRFSEGREDRFAALVAELLRNNVDVIVTESTAGARAEKKPQERCPSCSRVSSSQRKAAWL